MTRLRSLAGGPVQLAYCVADVRAAAVDWVGRGAGPFVVRDHIPLDDTWVADGSGLFDHSSAYGQWGDVMVELVAVHSPLGLRTVGLHHMAFFVPSFGDALEELTAAGYPCVMRARAGGTDFAFHDARDALGHYIEIYEGSDGLRAFYAAVATAAADWDGVEPFADLS